MSHLFRSQENGNGDDVASDIKIVRLSPDCPETLRRIPIVCGLAMRNVEHPEICKIEPHLLIVAEDSFGRIDPDDLIPLSPVATKGSSMKHLAAV